ncbi:rna polymerase ii transcriptional coactivator [Holotrichia oblita]|uniref:Rna polymerase ii transcriptional coactivator n=1 Tax=Holotrichia oblita TaxID=644536 RepID=A0ACB9SMW3_HOLOL|nr:rna polymerase ii transcriptional coactivator [Holotrichia oblita]
MPKNRPSKKDSSDSDSGPEDRNPVKKSKPNPPPPKSTSTRSEGGEPSWELGKNRSVKLTEFKGKWYINIREYYMGDDGDLKPGKKGIMLTMEQWQKFRGVIDEIDEAIRKHV